jgi:FKBP-type peptidyl-prolyl cis-trans isomerase FkpA
MGVKTMREKRRAARAARRRRLQIGAGALVVLLAAAILYFGFADRLNPSAPADAGFSNLDVEKITTASGLQIQEIAAGTGVEAKAGDSVSVHYTGWLIDGTKFDSSLDRGQPFEFVLGAGGVILGWDEGVEGMQPGGKRRLTIPAELGYGASGRGPVIPPNATLVFDVELIEIK